MQISDRGIVELLSHEGIVTSRYRDSTGVWTVGAGHTAAAGDPDPETVVAPLPLAALIAIFRRDLARHEDRVRRAVRVPLAQHEFDALVSFDYNTGGIFRARLTEHLNAGDRAAAAAAFMGWLIPPEIGGRRQAEMRLFRDGICSGDGRVAVFPADADGRVLWGQGSRIDALELLARSPAPGREPALADDPRPALTPESEAAIRRIVREEIGNARD